MPDEADFGQLAEDLSPEDLRVVLGVFATDVKRLTATLNAAAADQDLVNFKRVAHGLAGAAGAVGAKALEMACRTAMVRTEIGPDGLQSAAGAIDRLAETALSQMEAFVAQLDDGAASEHE